MTLPLPNDLRKRFAAYATMLTATLDDSGMFAAQTARDCTENLHTTLNAFAEDIEAAQTDRELAARMLRTFDGALARLSTLVGKGSGQNVPGATIADELANLLEGMDEQSPAQAAFASTLAARSAAEHDEQSWARQARLQLDMLGRATEESFDTFRLRRVMTRNELELRVRAEVERLNSEAQKLEIGVLRAHYGRAIDRLLKLLPKENEPTLFFLAATGEILLEKPHPDQVWDGGGRCYHLPTRLVDEIRLAIDGAMLVEEQGMVYAPQVLIWLDKEDLDREDFDKQIKQLRSEAREHDDDELIALCNGALDVREAKGESIDLRSVVECRRLVADTIAKRTKLAATDEMKAVRS